MTGYSYPEFCEAVVRLRGRGCWVEALLRARLGPKVGRIENLDDGSTAYIVGADAFQLASFAGCDGEWDAHHLVPKQRIRREYPDGHFMSGSDLPDLLMDPRNGVICCRRHHDLLERRLVVPTRAELPEDAVEFAEEIGMGWSVERDYPAVA